MNRKFNWLMALSILMTTVFSGLGIIVFKAHHTYIATWCFLAALMLLVVSATSYFIQLNKTNMVHEKRKLRDAMSRNDDIAIIKYFQLLNDQYHQILLISYYTGRLGTPNLIEREKISSLYNVHFSEHTISELHKIKQADPSHSLSYTILTALHIIMIREIEKDTEESFNFLRIFIKTDINSIASLFLILSMIKINYNEKTRRKITKKLYSFIMEELKNTQTSNINTVERYPLLHRNIFISAIKIIAGDMLSYWKFQNPETNEFFIAMSLHESFPEETVAKFLSSTNDTMPHTAHNFTPRDWNEKKLNWKEYDFLCDDCKCKEVELL